MAVLYTAMAVVRPWGKSSGMMEKQMGFWVACKQQEHQYEWQQQQE